jgi:hypothetical protein
VTDEQEICVTHELEICVTDEQDICVTDEQEICVTDEQELCVTDEFGESALKKREKMVVVDFKVVTEDTEDLLSLEEKKLIYRNFIKESTIREYRAGIGWLEGNLMLGRKIEERKIA